MNGLPTTEAQSQRAVKELFEFYGWEVRRTEEDWHNRDGSGTPDLLCTSSHGLQLWIEMKRPASSRNPKGRVRKAQKERLIEWRKRGVPCCVADGVDETLQTVATTPGRCLFYNFVLGCCDELMAEYDWWPSC